MLSGDHSRPNRSDVHLSAEEETKIEEQTRDYFDALAPKRPTKPQRSDYSSSHHPTTTTSITSPELIKFNHLQTNDPPQDLIYNGSGSNQTTAAAEEEEYMETEYYKDLNCIDKQHHTTGTGFIKVVENNNGNDFRLASESSTTECHSASKGNPATNDWVPSQVPVADTEILGAHKPNRSDN